MRTLGLLGGMSWESTTTYYQYLNRLARDRLGGQHSAPLLIWSADFAPLSAMLAAEDWAGLTAVLADAARRLEAAGAHAVLICSNTMHLMAEDVQAALRVPVVHVAEATADALIAAGRRRPLLLATRFTMERGFYRDRLAARGIDAIIPSSADRDRLHGMIFDELVQGRFEPASRQAVADIAARAVTDHGVDSVILGCTEFGLLVGEGDMPVPVFDTAEIHARAGLALAFGD